MKNARKKKALSWIEVQESALIHNLGLMRRLVGPEVVLAPCVKGNGYGHGILQASRILKQAGADWVCVSSVAEAEALRKGKVRGPILVIGFIPKEDLQKVLSLNLKIFVYNLETAVALSALARKFGKVAAVHLKLDSGMGRQGILPEDFTVFAAKMKTLPGLRIEGIATHFANADDPSDRNFFNEQLGIFSRFAPLFPLPHAANSAALLLNRKSHYKLVRPGLAVYGCYPSRKVRAICLKRGLKLKPALSLKTKIAQIKTVPKGGYIGYGKTFKVRRPTKIAILPIGYYDGLDRSLSGKGRVLVRGRRAAMLGRISMDITVVDVSKIPGVQLEDEVTVIGRDGKTEIAAEELAEQSQTIAYEILSRLNENLPRFYL